jgi:hypothetical protein
MLMGGGVGGGGGGGSGVDPQGQVGAAPQGPVAAALAWASDNSGTSRVKAEWIDS